MPVALCPEVRPTHTDPSTCMSHMYSSTAIYSLDTSTKPTDRQAKMTKRTGAKAGASRWAVRTGMVGMPVTRAGDRMVVEYSMGISAEEEG